MVHCSICGKEFPDNISALEFLAHVSKEHKEDLEETKKEIVKEKWDKTINENPEECKKIVKEIQELRIGIKNKNIKRLN
jgi:hypothetical protein